MAIVNVIEDTRRATAGAGKDGGRRAEEWYTVLFDTAANGKPVAARIAPGIPRLGAPHREDVYLWVYDIDAQPMNGNPLLYEVNVKYRSAQTASDQGNPLAEPPVVEWTWEEGSDQFNFDADNKPYVNTNGDLFEPLSDPVSDQKLIIERNVQSFDPFAAKAYAYVVNSDSFANFPAGCALLKPISARQITDNPQFVYWRIHAEILFRVDPADQYARSWYRRVANTGFNIRDTVNGPIHRKLDSEGNLYPHPVLLKQDGREETNPASVVWLYFRRFRSLPFANLGLLT